MAHDTLTPAEVREVSRKLRAAGSKMPDRGYCGKLPAGMQYKEICHDAKGYFRVGYTGPIGAAKRKGKPASGMG